MKQSQSLGSIEPSKTNGAKLEVNKAHWQADNTDATIFTPFCHAELGSASQTDFCHAELVCFACSLSLGSASPHFPLFYTTVTSPIKTVHQHITSSGTSVCDQLTDVKYRPKRSSKRNTITKTFLNKTKLENAIKQKTVPIIGTVFFIKKNFKNYLFTMRTDFTLSPWLTTTLYTPDG